MRTPKILSSLGTLLYLYFAVKPPFNVGPFVQILNQFNKNIQPIITIMFWVAVFGCLLNLIFLIFIIVKDSKGIIVKRATFVSLLLLIVPVFVMYLLFVTITNQVYNLS
jgi:hypothetical protein